MIIKVAVKASYVQLQIKGPVVNTPKFRDNMEVLKKACGIDEWPHNALRHSFGSIPPRLSWRPREDISAVWNKVKLFHDLEFVQFVTSSVKDQPAALGKRELLKPSA